MAQQDQAKKPMCLLEEAMNLHKQGRKNAASAAWNAIPHNLRLKLQEFAIAIQDEELKMAWVSFRDPVFGDFIIRRDTDVKMDSVKVPVFLTRDLKDIIVELS